MQYSNRKSETGKSMGDHSDNKPITNPNTLERGVMSAVEWLSNSLLTFSFSEMFSSEHMKNLIAGIFKMASGFNYLNTSLFRLQIGFFEFFAP